MQLKSYKMQQHVYLCHSNPATTGGYSKVSGSASMQDSQGLRGMWGMEMRSRAAPLRMSRVKEAQAQVKDQE